MPQFAKTLLVYGGMASLWGMLILGLYLGGISARVAIVYLWPLLLVSFAIGALVDWFGLLALVVASLPFARLTDYEVAGVTWNVFTLGVLGFFLVGLFRALLVSRQLLELGLSEGVLLGFCLLYFVTTLLAEDIIHSGYLAFHAIFIPVILFYAVRLWVERAEQYACLKKMFCLSIAAFGAVALAAYLKTHERVEILGVPAISAATLQVTAFFFAVYGGIFKTFGRWVLGALLILGTLVTFPRMYLALILLSPLLYYLIRRGLGFSLLFWMLALSLWASVLLALNYRQFTPPAGYDPAKWSTWERMTDPNSWKHALYTRGFDLAESLALFREHPIMGSGLKPGLFITRHNLHFEWLEYGGLLGYSLILGFLLLHFWRFARWALVSREVAVNLLLAWTVLANALFNGIMHGYAPILVLFVLGCNEAYRAIAEATKALPAHTFRLTVAP